MQVGDVFSSQSVVKHQFDYVEAWAKSLGRVLGRPVHEPRERAQEDPLVETDTARLPGRFRRASATRLPSATQRLTHLFATLRTTT